MVVDFSGYCENDDRPKENFVESENPLESDLEDCRESGSFATGLSGVCDRRIKGWSIEDAGRAGAVGGDIAPVELREVPNGDDADGLEKSEVG